MKAGQVRSDRLYTNPVIPFDAPDPYLTSLGQDGFELTVTGPNFPMYRTTDLVHYVQDGSIFTDETAPKWATDSFWAPEIHGVGSGFVAYYSARDEGGMLRIGAAVADNVHGPYRDLGAPIVSNPEVGVIDPTLFVARDGSLYLYWKEDGNGSSPPRPCRIMAARLSADGLRLDSEPVAVLEEDDDVLEAPEVVQHDRLVYLFDAHGSYATADYSEVVARSASPLGPFERRPTPLLHSGPDTLQGPGHASAPVHVGDNDYLLYAGWLPDHVGQPPGRVDGLDRLTWGQDGWPHVQGDVPSNTPQSDPPGTRPMRTGEPLPPPGPIDWEHRRETRILHGAPEST